MFQQAGHLAPELIGCRFPAAVLTELKSVMQRDFSPLFEPDDPILLYGPVQWASRLRTLLNLMRSAAGEPDCPGIIYLSLLLHYVDQECKAERQTARPRNETVEQICAYLAANYQQKFSLTDVAARFYLSPYYLSRLFRRVTGQSIVDYINGRPHRGRAASAGDHRPEHQRSGRADRLCLGGPLPPGLPGDDGRRPIAIPQEQPRLSLQKRNDPYAVCTGVVLIAASESHRPE